MAKRTFRTNQGNSSGGGSNVILNLNAGEDIDGITEPKAVFQGVSVAKTPTIDRTTAALPIQNGDYDYSAVTNGAGGVNVNFTGTRRASSFVTPAYDTTVNTIVLLDMEGNITGTINANIEVGIYSDNAGEPGTLLINFTAISYDNLNNNFNYLINLGGNQGLAPSTTYWIVADTGTDGGNVVNFNNTDPGLGLIFSGGNWIAGERFAAAVGLVPFFGDVYKSFYNGVNQPRASFLGMTVQNISEGNPIDVIHDGTVPGFSGLSTQPETQYVSTSVAGEIQTSPTNTVKVGTATKTDEIVINRIATYQ